MRKSDKRLNAGSVTVCTTYSEFTAVWDKEAKNWWCRAFLLCFTLITISCCESFQAQLSVGTAYIKHSVHPKGQTIYTIRLSDVCKVQVVKTHKVTYWTGA